LIYELSKLETDIKWSTQKTIMFQAGIIKLCSNEFESSNNIEERVDKIEKYLKSGRVAVNTMQVPVSATTVNQTQNYNLNNRVQSTPKVASNTVKQNTMANKPKQYSSDLSKSWPTIVNDLKQNGKIVLYTNLMNTSAEEINDMTVGIKFPNGLSSFGKTVLEKQENIKEISTLVSMACGKEMQIKYISEAQSQAVVHRPEDDIQKLANQSDIPFNVIE
jgi:DNA polymerase-3 subunit gamma/tau